MQVIPLYRYQRSEGGITVSPKKPENTDFFEAVRIIADEGKILVKEGQEPCYCLDVETIEGWHEIDDLSDDNK